MLKTLSMVAAVLLFQSAAPPQNSAFTVSGTVVREDSQDPARAINSDRVVLRGSGPATIIDIGPGGAFEFTNVRPGTYQIVVGPVVTMEPVTVVVTDRDVRGLRLLVPSVVLLSGKVIVEGGGPLPRFQMSFSRIDGPAAGAAPINATVAARLAAQLPPGQYRITSSGLPNGYTLKSVTVDTTDVLTQPLKVAAGDSEPITITLGVSSPPPWVKVSGRVSGSNPISAPPTGVTISGESAAESVNVTLTAGGFFEFPRVLPGSYTALVAPITAVSTAVNLTVGTTDVTNFEIRIPEPKEISGRIVVQGNRPIPRVVFSVGPAGGAFPGARPTNFPANPQPDGSFKIALPEGERPITLVTGGLPPGYKLASFTYGSTDLLKDPLRVAMTDNSELRVTFDATAVTPVNVSGRVTGLLTTQSARVVLMSQVIGNVEAPVKPDGSFTFANVIPGNYVARLSLSGLSASTSIRVADRDVTDVIIANRREFVVTGHTIVEGGFAGAPPQVVLEAKDVKTGSGTLTTSNAIERRVIMLNLGDGEYTVSVRSLPSGYQLKSITYGTTDLQKAPLKIDGPVTWEIIVRLVPL